MHSDNEPRHIYSYDASAYKYTVLRGDNLFNVFLDGAYSRGSFQRGCFLSLVNLLAYSYFYEHNLQENDVFLSYLFVSSSRNDIWNDGPGSHDLVGNTYSAQFLQYRTYTHQTVMNCFGFFLNERIFSKMISSPWEVFKGWRLIRGRDFNGGNHLETLKYSYSKWFYIAYFSYIFHIFIFIAM